MPSAPATLTDCNCSICRRYGVLKIRFMPCGTRGCLKNATRLGVNARLFDLADMTGVRIRKLDGAGTEEYVVD